VLLAYRDLGLARREEAQRGLGYLVRAQNADGGWGGARGVPSSVEETALAVEALAAWPADAGAADACLRGARHLADRIAAGDLARPAPIGLYFATLWYSERLYPIIYAVAALGSVLSSRNRTVAP
jgi:squalene-hopene/tetraprenyl-beta-curcumene cyclase